jgi:hypothetical protein
MSIANLFSRDAAARYLEGRQQEFPPHYHKTAAAWQGLLGVALSHATPKLRALAANVRLPAGRSAN